MAAPGGSHKRQAGLKPAEKAKLLVEYAQLPADKGGWKVGAGACIGRNRAGCDRPSGLYRFVGAGMFYGRTTAREFVKVGGAIEARVTGP